jgi:ABC-type transporter Mla subunit MlaD
MNDKTFGYILIAIVLFLSACIGYYLVQTYYSPREIRTLRFPEVGSLAIQDPVRMEGTYVGEIGGFDHDDSGRVLVYVKSKEPIPIRTSSYVAVKVKGVMGERFIEVSTGNLSDPLIDKDQIIDGKFEMGPSEAISYMDLLAVKITELVDIMLWLRDGKDDGKRPFIVAFNDVVDVVDTLVLKLLTGLCDMEEGLNTGLDTAAQIAVRTAKLTKDVAGKAPEIISDLDSMMIKIDKLASKVDTLITRIDPIVTKIDENKYLWGDHVEKLQKQLATVRKHLNDLREDGLPLTIKLKFF